MKILLTGNPNVGKSVIFNRLTGIDGMQHVLIDVHGTYTLEPTCKVEEIAVLLINSGYVIINVIDSTNLERSLNLLL